MVLFPIKVVIAKSNLQLEKERHKQNKNDVKAQIAQAYLNVMLRELQRRITLSEEQRYKEYEQVTLNKFKIGTLIENDYLKSQLDYENAKAETLKATQNYELALDNMKYQINMSAESKLVLSDSLSSVHVLFDQLPAKKDTMKWSNLAGQYFCQKYKSILLLLLLCCNVVNSIEMLVRLPIKSVIELSIFQHTATVSLS